MQLFNSDLRPEMGRHAGAIVWNWRHCPRTDGRSDSQASGAGEALRTMVYEGARMVDAPRIPQVLQPAARNRPACEFSFSNFIRRDQDLACSKPRGGDLVDPRSTDRDRRLPGTYVQNSWAEAGRHKQVRPSHSGWLTKAQHRFSGPRQVRVAPDTESRERYPSVKGP